MRKRLYIWISAVAILVLLLAMYVYRYYPKQKMPIGEPMSVTTEDTIYHNDCLHPCIRYDAQSNRYYMAQSPYYAENNKLENPLLYESDDYRVWHNEKLIADTPEKGYNSDPNICLRADGSIYYIWRECRTPLCDSIGCENVTVGGKLNDNCQLETKNVYCINYFQNQDIEQAPVMIEHNGERYIYATWYQYEPNRRNKGIAIWAEGDNDSQYRLVDTIPFESCSTVGKCAQVRLFGHIFYVPRPSYHDVWHFDLFAYEDKLYMVSAGERGDDIMLSVSDDWRHFKTYRTR